MSKNSAQKKKTSHPVVTAAPEPTETAIEIPSSSETSLPDDSHSSKTNVSRRERVASGVVGSGLLLYGLPNFLTLPGQVSNVTGLYLVGRAVTGRCLIYNALGVDSTPNGRLHHRGVTDPHPVQLRQTLTVARSPQDVFAFCRDQEQLGPCFPTVKQVQSLGHNKTRWTFSDKAGLLSFPVIVELTHEIENEQITWTAFPESHFRLNGNLQFQAGAQENETEIIVTVHMIPPAGIMGSRLMKWFSPVTEDALAEILDRVKQRIETGTIGASESPIPKGIKNPFGGWQNRFKSHFHVRTMQSLVSRGI